MTFWTPKKSPKKRQGVCADRLSADMTLVPIPSGLRPYPLDKGSRPLDPYLRGPPMRRFSVDAKARVAQSIPSSSITAAAEGPVTFGQCSYWLEARLLGWRAQVRLRETAYSETSFEFCRGGTLGRPGFPGLPHVLAIL